MDKPVTIEYKINSTQKITTEVMSMGFCGIYSAVSFDLLFHIPIDNAFRPFLLSG